MADLAEAAQVSVGTIYRSFPGKSEVIRAIVLADTEGTLSEIQGDIALVKQGVDPAIALGGMILRWLSKRDDAMGHEIVAECHRNPQLAQLVACVCGRFRDQFRLLAALLQPQASDIQIEGAAELFLACLFGMGGRDVTSPRLDDAQTATVVTSLILKALR